MSESVRISAGTFIRHFFLGERGQRAMELLHQRKQTA